ncbi:M20 metallopeptidase family protein [Merdimmobilis hominis]|uniref:M20 metallopeptidase family protein n=1 Tax=Merdimmobilis hominis TaxID=2897707 RepID=UPI0006C7A7DC|nr:M20 family metallopeptidase [Merdimmobilis hominis]PWL58213.1 MAG: amidohydrolase [Oscillospiraceae bacterium]PWL62269.1 MAG: amidohydrolase [Oscillospiraceae bacterium]
MNDLLKSAKAIEETIVKDRRTIHQNPELGNDLPQTTRYIMDRLTEMGYEPKEICKSGVVATVGKPGKTILLRADTDALRMPEKSGLPFASQNPEAAHTCGHDTHAAMLLGAAKLLKDRENELCGTVKLMFQPAEEILAGAKAMIDAGVLENPHVDAAVAIHISSVTQPAGFVGFTKGGSHGSADKFVITVKGKGGHGANPHTAIDPITAGSHIVIALQEILAREIDAADTATMTIGAFQSGLKENVIPDEAMIMGTIRTKSSKVRTFMKQRLVEVAKAVASAFRCDCEVEYPFGVAPLENDNDLMDEIVGYTRDLLGEDKVQELPGGMGSEDFSLVTEKVPGIFLRLGAMPSDPEKVFPAHNPNVLFDESAFPIGSAVYANAAIQWLKNNQ